MARKLQNTLLRINICRILCIKRWLQRMSFIACLQEYFVRVILRDIHHSLDIICQTGFEISISHKILVRLS